MEVSKYLNTKIIIFKPKERPCHKLKYCPYGTLVEEFPLRNLTSKYSCKTFGHDCPVYYHGEAITEK